MQKRGSNVFARIFAAGVAWMACVATVSAAEPLRIGMIPDAGATQVSVEEKAPLQTYLEQQLGRPVKLIIPTNYNAAVEGLGNGSLDIAYLGGLTYVKAHVLYGAEPLVQRDVDRRFQGLFITRVDTGIANLAGLKGKTFCFGDINSTSGHLFPYLAMKQAGIDPEKDLKSFRYTGSHAATAQAVASGACDAGSLDETVYKGMGAAGKIPVAKMAVFDKTRTFTDYVWAARQGLDADTAHHFSDAFLRLQSGRDDAVLKILRAEHYVRADNASYDDVQKVARELRLMQ